MKNITNEIIKNITSEADKSINMFLSGKNAYKRLSVLIDLQSLMKKILFQELNKRDKFWIQKIKEIKEEIIK